MGISLMTLDQKIEFSFNSLDAYRKQRKAALDHIKEIESWIEEEKETLNELIAERDTRITPFLSNQHVADILHDWNNSYIVVRCVNKGDAWNGKDKGPTDNVFLNTLINGMSYTMRDSNDDPKDSIVFNLESLKNGFEVLCSSFYDVYTRLHDGSYDSYDVSALIECAAFGEVIYG